MPNCLLIINSGKASFYNYFNVQMYFKNFPRCNSWGRYKKYIQNLLPSSMEHFSEIIQVRLMFEK